MFAVHTGDGLSSLLTERKKDLKKRIGKAHCKQDRPVQDMGFKINLHISYNYLHHVSHSLIQKVCELKLLLEE